MAVRKIAVVTLFALLTHGWGARLDGALAEDHGLLGEARVRARNRPEAVVPRQNQSMSSLAQTQSPGFTKPQRPPSLFGFTQELPAIFDLHVATIREFIAMFLYMVLAISSACALAPDAVCRTERISLMFALTSICLMLAFKFGSATAIGVHLNPVLSLALWLADEMHWLHLVIIVLAQLMGAIAGSYFLIRMYPKDTEGEAFGNVVAEGHGRMGAFLYEAMMSFVSVSVVMFCRDIRARTNGETSWLPCSHEWTCISFGIVTFYAHMVLVPITGCSLNPARSLGPAIVSALEGRKGCNRQFTDMWIFCIAPTIGAAIAAAARAFI